MGGCEYDRTLEGVDDPEEETYNILKGMEHERGSQDAEKRDPGVESLP